MSRQQIEKPSDKDLLKMGKGGSRKSEYSKDKPKQKKRKNPTRDLSAGGAFNNVLKIARRQVE